MGEIGHYFLVIAWLLALFATCAGVYVGIKSKLNWHRSVLNATLLVALSSTISVFCLAFGFLNDDYTNQYIWQYSNRDMDPVYKFTAVWGGMDGSLLFWAFVLSVAGAVVAWKSRIYPRTIMPWVLAVLNSSYVFFFSLVLFFTNPFRYLQTNFVPPDGNGLNPLLQNPYMAIHPPMLYAGFTLFAIPYALCMGALIAGQSNNDWLAHTRRWTLIAWAFLTVGIVLGGYWAYIELGWGGYWAWDPVENASFLPWLTGTAFLHSVIVQRRRNILRLWNVWMITLTYGLTIFGTFLTRSGIVQSVHAFASTDIGWVFLLYLAIIFGFTLVVTFWRRKELSSEAKIESLLSRETVFLLSSLVFLTICFATCWGVMFPILSEAMTGVKQTVGAPYFNTINVPLFLLMILLMGVGQLIAWRKSDPSKFKKNIVLPLLSTLVLGSLLFFLGGFAIFPVLSYSLCFLVLSIILGEVYRDYSLLRMSHGSGQQNFLSASLSLFRKKRRGYGGHLVHIGVLIAVVSITASTAHKIEKEFTLAKEESYSIGGYTLVLDRIAESRHQNYNGLFADVTIRSAKDSSLITELKPELRHYRRNRESTTEVALHVGFLEDIYLVLAGLDNSGERAAFKVYINPLQVWLWFGVVVMLAGVALVLLPQTSAVRSFAAEATQAEGWNRV